MSKLMSSYTTRQCKPVQDAIIAVLPPLTGSPKQVAWASDLRDEVVVGLILSHERGLAKLDDAQLAAAIDQVKTLVAGSQLATVTEAKRWINQAAKIGEGSLALAVVSGKTKL